MPDQIFIDFYELRSTRFSYPQLVKCAEVDPTHMTIPELEKLFEIEEMLGRTFQYRRIPCTPNHNGF